MPDKPIIKPLSLDALYSEQALAEAVTSGLVSGGDAGGKVKDLVVYAAKTLGGAGSGAAIKGILGNLTASLSSLAGVAALVVAIVQLLKKIVPGIEKAAGETWANWTQGRVWLVSSNSGRVPTHHLPSVGCGHPASYRFKRTFAGSDNLAEDRCVPYCDPLGTLANQLTDYIRGLPGLGTWGTDPGRWDPYPVPRDQWYVRPYDMSLKEYGWWFPSECVDWATIWLDLYQQDCSWDPYTVSMTGANRYTIVWPYAWPLLSPARVQGTLTAASEQEPLAASLFLLPTRQHMTTLMADVREAERYILSCLRRHYPFSYRQGGELVRQQELEQYSGGGDFWVGPRPDFWQYQSAIARIWSFKRTRITLRNNYALLDADLKQAAQENPDWEDVR